MNNQRIGIVVLLIAMMSIIVIAQTQPQIQEQSPTQTQIQSQEQDEIYRVGIGIHPISALAGYYQIQGMFALTRGFVTGARIDLYCYTIGLGRLGDNVSGYTVHVPFRYYFMKNYLSGAFIGPHVFYRGMTVKNETKKTDDATGTYYKTTEKFKSSIYGFGVEVGGTFVFSNFMLEIGVRLSYRTLNTDNKKAKERFVSRGVGIPIVIGFAF